MKSLNITTATLYLLALLSLSMLISSCASEGVIEEEPQIFVLPQSQELITATISGVIMDETSTPLVGAIIQYKSGLESVEVISDDYGYFILQDIQNKGNAAYISVNSPGKFEAFRKFSLVASRYNYTEVMMMDREIIGAIASVDGGSLSREDGSKVTLPPGGIIDDSGLEYTGQVDVAMTWIDPSSDDLSRQMVGDLSGLDASGVYRSLGSFGMLQVELTGASGRALNIASDAEAQLTFPIPAEMRGDAPVTIPLWSYNESLGTWIQEGEAIRQGSEYIGAVGHFSAWNVDVMTDPIEISGKVLLNTEEGKEVGGSYLQVYVCGESFGRKGGWLCEDGSFRFYNFPKAEKFQLKVLDKCGGQVFKETYGPFDSDTHIGDIVVNVQQNIVEVVGNAVDCNLEPLSGAQLFVKQGDFRTSYPINDNGEFDFALDFCSAEKAILEVINLGDLLSNTAEIIGGQKVVEVKDLKVCEDLEQFVSYTFDEGDPIILTNINEGVFGESEEVDGKKFKSYWFTFSSEDSNPQDSVDRPGDIFSTGFGLAPETLELVGESRVIVLSESRICITDPDDMEAEMTLTITGYEAGPDGFVSASFEVIGLTCDNGMGPEIGVTKHDIKGQFRVLLDK